MNGSALSSLLLSGTCPAALLEQLRGIQSDFFCLPQQAGQLFFYFFPLPGVESRPSADKAAPAPDRIEKALALQFCVGSLYGVGVCGKLHGQLADRGNISTVNRACQ